MTEITLNCQEVLFYSEGDENVFFQRLETLKSVKSITGQCDSILLGLELPVPDSELRELLALFLRYEVDMKQLSQLRTSKNENWFVRNENAFWHSRVFRQD